MDLCRRKNVISCEMCPPRPSSPAGLLRKAGLPAPPAPLSGPEKLWTWVCTFQMNKQWLFPLMRGDGFAAPGKPSIWNNYPTSVRKHRGCCIFYCDLNFAELVPEHHLTIVSTQQRVTLLCRLHGRPRGEGTITEAPRPFEISTSLVTILLVRKTEA